VVAVLAAPALAHVPAFGADNDDPGNATLVPNPTKSWAYYDRLEAGGAAYYEATYLQGEQLYLSTYTPSRNLRPSLVVLAPRGGTGETGPDDGGESRSPDAVPDAVEVPEGYEATVIEGERAEGPEFEPFTPGAYVYTASVDRTVERAGTYLIAIYDADGRAGPVGLAIGRTESFTPVEYLTVPVDALAIHAWEGDSPLLIWGPGLLVALGGIAVLRRRLDGQPAGSSVARRGHAGREYPIARWAVGLAAVAIFATTAMLGTQFAVALATAGPSVGAVLTTALVLIPGAIAAWLGRVATAEELELTRRHRVTLLLAGAGCLATWAGLVVAPLVPMGLALLPERFLR